MTDLNKDTEKADIKKDEIIIVHCWSSPRSRSTAFMYSWNSRSDCVSLDEPLYRDWLDERKERKDVYRPYKEKLLNGCTDGNEEGEKWNMQQLSIQRRIEIMLSSNKSEVNHNDGNKQKIVFCKHMAKHFELFDFEKNIQLKRSEDDGTIFGDRHVHVLLLRDPVAIASSWKAASSNHGNALLNPDEIGTIPILSIYSKLMSFNKTSSTIIIDSDNLASNPEHALQCLCDQIQIPFQKEMLSWSIGPKQCDGPWASFWYSEVHKSSGWNSMNPIHKSYKTIDPSMLPLLRLNLPIYQQLKKSCITQKVKNETFLNEDLEDKRNANILCWIGPPQKFGGGQLLPRDMAGISPFDSAVQGGDSVWEGLRIYKGKILSLEEHLTRLFQSSKAMGFQNVHSKEEVINAIFATLGANGMRDNAHIRLSLTRGVKCTSSMNPKFNLYGTTLIVLAEWKPVAGGRTTYDNTRGITLITAANRRNPPSCVDSKIHHNNLINNILPKIQANYAGAADAIMLDLEGFVSETNATNIFMVNHKGTLLTPHADSCLPGITRATVMKIAIEECNLTVEERRVSLAEFHAAEEVFTTGTMGGLSPVTSIDGRIIGNGEVGPVTKKLQQVYKTLCDRPEWTTIIPPFE